MASKRIRTGTIAVEGLDDFARAVRKMDNGLAEELRGTNKKVATTVKDKALGNAHSLGGVAAHVAPSLSANAGAKSASVAFGGPSQPAAGGAEFGSINYPQFAAYRGNGSDAGYFLVPAIRDEAPHIEDEYRKALETLIRKANLD